MVAQAEVSALRVVLDTNVLLSALLFKSGRVNWLVPLWTGRRIVPLVSKATACELIRVLAYPKFRLGDAERQAVLASFLPYAETVRTSVRTTDASCRDPHDEAFLVVAEQGQAAFLVTGDEDLLAVKGFAACPIITPAHFKERFTRA